MPNDCSTIGPQNMHLRPEDSLGILYSPSSGAAWMDSSISPSQRRWNILDLFLKLEGLFHRFIPWKLETCLFNMHLGTGSSKMTRNSKESKIYIVFPVKSLWWLLKMLSHVNKDVPNQINFISHFGEGVSEGGGRMERNRTSVSSNTPPP